MTTRLRSLVQANPVTLKELRGRMRGPRAFAVLTVYLVLMSGFAVTLYVLYAAALNAGEGITQTGQIGRTLFTGIVGIELFLVTFIVPAFTAGAITGERERQTYDLLRTTLISPRAMVTGKLVSALAYIFLLLLAAIPLQSLAFLFGGVSETEIAIAFVILLVTAIALGTIGIYFSCVMQRTLAASIATYGFALLITVGLPLVISVVGVILVSLYNALFHGVEAPLTLQAALLYLAGAVISTNPLATAYVSQVFLVDRQVVGTFTLPITSGGATMNLPFISPWIVYTVFYLLVSAVLLLLSIRRVARIEGEPR